MKMKHSEVLTLKNKLSRVTGLTCFNTKIAIRRNIDRIEIAIKPLIDEEKEISEFVKDYRAEYNEMNKRLSGGKTKISTQYGQQVELYDVPESKKEEFKKELDELETKHKAAIEKYEEKSKNFQIFLKETESSFKPIMIPMSQIEEFDQSISQENLDAIWSLIIDDKDNTEK